MEADWSCMIKCFKVEHSNESGAKEETCTIYLEDLLLNNTVTHPLCALKIAGIYPVALGHWLLSQ